MSAGPQLTLDGTWRFQIDRNNQGEARFWHTPAYQPEGWLEVTLPNNWDTHLPELFGYSGHGWYRRTFELAPEWQGRRMHLRFEGANYQTTVWLNGTLIGTHRGGFDPFQFDVTERLDPKGENTLVVRLDNRAELGRVPNSLGGWWNYGGIYRSVTLLALPAVRIADVFVRAEPGHEPGGAPMRIEVNLANDGDELAELALEGEVRLGETPLELSGLMHEAVTVAAGGQALLSLSSRLPNPRLWSPAEPNLYTLQLTLFGSGQPLDARDLTFGVRRFETRGTQCYLNGAPVRLTGVNRHEEYSGSGRVDPGGLLEADLKLIKSLGGNMVRLHYQAHPDLYTLADRLGLLVFAEIPLWGVGNVDPLELSEASVRESAEAMLRTLIGELKNHPSVVIWSVGNECATKREESRPLIRHLVAVARSLDTSRPVAYVGMFGAEERCFDLVDLPCINTYVGLDTAKLKDLLDRVHALEPDKPLFVTEFGHEAILGLHGEGFGTEEEQARVLRENW